MHKISLKVRRGEEGEIGREIGRDGETWREGRKEGGRVRAQVWIISQNMNTKLKQSAPI